MPKVKKIKAYGVLSLYHYKALFIPSGDEEYKRGDLVVFSDKESGNEIGRIIFTTSDDTPEEISVGMSILRKATDHDIQKMHANREAAADAMNSCKDLIDEFNLNMHLIDVIYSLDSSRINFVFTSEDRVDFRELVKKLAQKFQKQIHLQQIGPRDKARFIRGYGKCGRRLCCGQAVGKLKSITMDMVRVQNMSNKGSEKLSGVCGKLMCCLAYEVENYEDLRKNIPAYLSNIVLKDGKKGILKGVDILNQKIRIEDENGDFSIADVSEIKKVTSPRNVNLETEDEQAHDLIES